MKKILLALLLLGSISAIQSRSYSQLIFMHTRHIAAHTFHLVKRHPYISTLTTLAILAGIYWYSIQNDYDNE